MPHVVCEVRCARLSLSPVACNPWPVRLGTATHALPRSQTCIEYHSARSFEFGEKEVQFPYGCGRKYHGERGGSRSRGAEAD
jgi:hypothetical protein